MWRRLLWSLEKFHWHSLCEILNGQIRRTCWIVGESHYGTCVRFGGKPEQVCKTLMSIHNYKRSVIFIDCINEWSLNPMMSHRLKKKIIKSENKTGKRQVNADVTDVGKQPGKQIVWKRISYFGLILNAVICKLLRRKWNFHRPIYFWSAFFLDILVFQLS